jgi:hypothetical protein
VKIYPPNVHSPYNCLNPTFLVISFWEREKNEATFVPLPSRILGHQTRQVFDVSEGAESIQDVPVSHRFYVKVQIF